MGKQRSVHNTYFTLPAVFAMISNHYAMTFGHRWGWLVLVALTIAGALVRVWFVMRHKGRAPAWVWLLGAGCVIAAIFLVMPREQAGAKPVAFTEVKQIIDTRCVACHADKPSFQGLAEPPKGVKLDTAARVRAQALQIHQQTVLSRAMPPGNLTGLTEEERSLLDRWYRSGAGVE
jgi:uncharacterized membrane protein